MFKLLKRMMRRKPEGELFDWGDHVEAQEARRLADARSAMFSGGLR